MLFVLKTGAAVILFTTAWRLAAGHLVTSDSPLAQDAGRAMADVL